MKRSVGPDDERYGPLRLPGEPAARPGIAATAYDTAWLAAVPAERDRRRSRFPQCLQWLVDHQFVDGSWGGEIRYQHDRILCTLAALASLAAFGHQPVHRACVVAGTRYLWQNGHLLGSEPTELVAFELLLPALIERARRAGVAVPPHLHIYETQRQEKLRIIPEAALYSPHASIVHSLEFLGEQVDLAGLQASQASNGSIGNSPAATAFFLAHREDARALAYLAACLAWTGGEAAPVAYPCETFELLWTAYHLWLAGVPAARLLSAQERRALREALQAGGVSWSASFSAPDADNTAVALLLLHDLGLPVAPSVLQGFALPDGRFATYPYERHSSVGVNLHVLHALLRVPGYPAAGQIISRLLDYLAGQHHHGLYWLDKWHISPYYATAHALCVLRELPPEPGGMIAPLVAQSREWLRQTQNGDGSWGFFGRSTAEETAYGVLALTAVAAAERLDQRDRQRCEAAVQYLDKTRTAPGTSGGDLVLPPLWVEKCLYTPTLVVQAVLESARIAYARQVEGGHATGDDA